MRPSIALGLGIMLQAATGNCGDPVEQVDVYTSGQDGYAVYRIPAVISTTSGTLLAFAEGRMNGRSDAGRIDLVVKRSSDGGRSWGPMKIVWSDGANTCGNPAPVVDAKTGRIHLLSTWNLAQDAESRIQDGTSTDTRRVFKMHSDDDGLSWSPADEITSSVKQPNWRWYATGPCHGIQLKSGRLVISANHSHHDGTHGRTSSHAIFSDDGGVNWQAGAPVGGHTNESTVAELDDGRLYLNMRSYRGLKQRAEAFSSDNGKTWSEPINNPVLVEPVCQGSVLRVPQDSGQSLYLFSNPGSTKRELMTVRLSEDACQTWTSGTVIFGGRSAYSDLCALPGKQVGLLYEREDDKQPNGRITFARFPLSAIDSSPATTASQTLLNAPVAKRKLLPSLPDPNGFAGAFAGISGKALLVAGGANFPAGKPWEGGKKVYYDKVFLLEDKATSWTIAGTLPRPMGYGCSLTTSEGVLCIGGEDGTRALADVTLMRREGNSVSFTNYAPLPVPCINACAALVRSKVYVMGGTERPGATAASANVFVLDLKKRDDGWKKLESWPGEPRMLATTAVVGDSVYLCSGTSLAAGSDGKPVRTYLTDAYRLDTRSGRWERVADLPRPAIAAATPAPSLKNGMLCILGGDDGKLASRPPGPDHPGFTGTALYYDSNGNTWSEREIGFQPAVTLAAVQRGSSWILPSGEVRPGVRTPEISIVNFTDMEMPK